MSYIYIYAKMAAEEKQQINDVLETLVSVTEKSGKLRKDLKQDIHESVSKLRKLFSHLMNQLETVKHEYSKYREEVKNATNVAASGGHSHPTRQVAPSLDHTPQSGTNAGRQVPTSGGGVRKKLFSEVVKQLDTDKRYRITLKPKEDSITTDQIKHQLKESINPTDIKVGIKAVKTIKDKGLLIETGSEEERNILSAEISNKLGDRLDIIQHKLRKPRIIIYNVPDETTTENVEATIRTQNPELQTNDESMQPKFRYKNKRGKYNIVMEVSPQARKQLLQTKLKIGWEICNTADYLVPTRCFKCSRFNHKHYDCRSAETCPHCTGNHKMKECTAAASEHKCINCITHNRYSKEGKVNENHSALSKDCTSLQAVLKRYRSNIEY